MISKLEKNLKLNHVYPLAILFISISTFLIRKFGPEPYIYLQNKLVSIDGLTIVEKRDQYILISWWLVLFLLFVYSLIQNPLKSKKFLLRKIDYLLFAIAIFLTLLSAMWPYDLHKTLTGISLWSGIHPFPLFTCVVLSLILLYSLTKYNFNSNRIINFSIYTIFILFIFPNLIQFPKYLDDQNHFNFVANDLMINSIGKTVLFDYFPVYSNILGIPIAPLLKLSPVHPIQITVYYLVFLQGLIILFSFLLLRESILKRLLPLTFLISVLPLFATGDIGRGATSYFPIFPLRIVIPVFCVFITFKFIFSKAITKYTFLFIGFCLGLNIFNNLEFGLTSSLAIVLATALVFYKTTYFKRFLIESVFGIFLFHFAYYLIFLFLNKPLDLGKLFIFIKLTLSGFYAIPMDAMGIHLVIICLFLTGTIISSNFLIDSPFTNSFIYRRNYLLFIFSFWSVISLPYFTGRSFPSTMIGGFAFQYGITFALFIPTLFKMFKLSKGEILQRIRLTIFGFLGLSIILSLLFTINNPLNKLKTILEYRAESSDFVDLKLNLNFYRTESSDKTLVNAIRDGQISQILPLSAALQSQLNFPSELITNHPWHLEVTPLYTSLQCEYSKKSTYRFVLTTVPVMNALALNAKCLDVFNFMKAVTLSELDAKFVIIPKK